MVGYQDPGLLARFLQEQGGNISDAERQTISSTIVQQQELRNPASTAQPAPSQPQPSPDTYAPQTNALTPQTAPRTEVGAGGTTIFNPDGSKTITYAGGLVVRVHPDGTTTDIISGPPSANHAINGGVSPEVIANPPDVLKEFLESDPALVLNAVLNKFRADGGSQVFLNWFGRNFDRFYGEYLGIVAQEALNGGVPKTQFTDWILSTAVARSYFGDTATARQDQSSRFAAFASQSGGQ